MHSRIKQPVRGYNMSENRFVSLCLEHNILPAVALENNDIVEALRERDDALVEQLLQESM